MPKRTRRSLRQAPEGEIAESALAEYEHGADAADDVALEVQEGIREMVLFALQPSTVWEIRWSAAGFPTLAGVEMLRRDPLFTNLGTDLMEQLLADDSE
jgi:hypothetical protein